MARVYDYWLGGSHNFLADQDAARALIAVEPNVREGARANRAFLGRAVRFLAAAGIRQFLDIGSGIPTERNVHEVAKQAAPDARVVYVDIDPVAVAHSKTILAGHEDATIIQADLRDPEKILAHQETRRLIDFTKPVALLLVAVLQSSRTPAARCAASRRSGAIAPGSYSSSATPRARAGRRGRRLQTVYNRSVAARAGASRAAIERFFDGFDLVPPGLVYIPEWRPDSPADVPDDPGKFWGLVGVGRKARIRASHARDGCGQRAPAAAGPATARRRRPAQRRDGRTARTWIVG